MSKKLIVGLIAASFAGSLLAAPDEDAEFVTPEELGWEAGVVAPSPLDPEYINPEFKTLEEAEKAKAIGEAELKRIEKLRAGHTYLCQKKIFVNDCIDRAETVLFKRSRIANQLIRQADHQIRIFKSQQRREKSARDQAMPAKRGSVKNNDEKIARQDARRAQEGANLAAYDEKLKAQEVRKNELEAAAVERKAKREARQRAYEAERQKRQEAQKLQDEQNKKDGFLF